MMVARMMEIHWYGYCCRVFNHGLQQWKCARL